MGGGGRVGAAVSSSRCLLVRTQGVRMHIQSSARILLLPRWTSISRIHLASSGQLLVTVLEGRAAE